MEYLLTDLRLTVKQQTPLEERSGKGSKVRARRKIDEQVAEFEKRDLGEDIRRAGAGRPLRVPSQPC
jgi:hypothetical protein